jgi:hypothetical protein
MYSLLDLSLSLVLLLLLVSRLRAVSGDFLLVTVFLTYVRRGYVGDAHVRGGDPHRYRCTHVVCAESRATTSLAYRSGARSPLTIGVPCIQS